MKLEKFKKLNALFRENFFDDIWLDTNISYAVIFDDFERASKKIISRIVDNNITAKNVEDIFLDLRKKCENCLQYFNLRERESKRAFSFLEIGFNLLDNFVVVL